MIKYKCCDCAFYDFSIPDLGVGECYCLPEKVMRQPDNMACIYFRNKETEYGKN